MAPIPNPRVIFAAPPKHLPVPNETLIFQPDAESIDLEEIVLNGGLLLKTLYLSVDPWMRVMLRLPEVSNESPPYSLGKPPAGGSVSLVIRSESAQYKKGDLVLSSFAPWQAYNVLSAGKIEPIFNPANLPLSTFLGINGFVGLTAYYGIKFFANWKAGETLYVNTAAGGVGSVVVQLAKLAGLRVIASTGSDEKVRYLEELGADVAFNYKTVSTREVLKREGPIDVTFDNVGGEVLDIALEHTAPFGRIILCGNMVDFNNVGSDVPTFGITNLRFAITRNISIHGFLTRTLIPQRLNNDVSDFIKGFLPLVASGKIKYKEDRTYGLDKLGEALRAVCDGSNVGKGIVVVAQE